MEFKYALPWLIGMIATILTMILFAPEYGAGEALSAAIPIGLAAAIVSMQIMQATEDVDGMIDKKRQKKAKSKLRRLRKEREARGEDSPL